MSIQSQLDSLYREVEAVTVECPCDPPESGCAPCGIYGCGVDGMAEKHSPECANGCNGTGHIPDPRLTPLRDALRVECRCQCHSGYADAACQADLTGASCLTCGGSHYVTRNVSDRLEGEVAGMLIVIMETQPSSECRDAFWEGFLAPQVLLSLLYDGWSDKPDNRIIAAVREVVRQLQEAGE